MSDNGHWMQGKVTRRKHTPTSHGFHLLKAEDFQVASIFYVKIHVIINVFLFVYVFLINTLFNTLSNKTVSKLNLVGYFKMRKCTGPI